MKHTPTHSPLPWSPINRGEFGTYIRNADGESVVTINAANAAFIVLACNNHDRLLAALKQVIASGQPHADEHPTMFRAWDVARQTIASVEGKV